MGGRWHLTVAVLAATIFLPDAASAQLETLVMPGEVIEGHAEIESECDNCHTAFHREEQTSLCLDCHEDVAGDINGRTGYHGLFGAARNRDCVACHSDHEGRDADIIGLDESRFNHNYTDFALLGGHASAQCRDCHEPEQKHRDAPSDCLACHASEDTHEGFLGEECGSCHVPHGWQQVEFDHDETGYALIGGHGEAQCLDCHADRTFRDTPTTCYGCHASDDAHDGRSGENCESCHNPTSWLETSFDHARDTSFPLTGSHAEQSCSSCHSEDPFADRLGTECVACHADDDAHDEHFGRGCVDCHSTTEWAAVSFDHAFDTGHSLNGAHGELECELCHIEPIFEVALGNDCHSCHAEDDPHDGTQGLACDDCHGEVDWSQNLFFDHDLTGFPLLGGHAEAECGSCHESHVYVDAPTECNACHEADDPHEGRFESDCALCHNPVDWHVWFFDHDTQTAFALTGSHADVACEACHRSALSMQSGSRCADCHRADDIHDGEFGSDCARCHNSDTFRDVRTLR